MVKIEKLDDFGRGICFIDGKVTFVKNATVGDVLDVRITKSYKKYNEGVVDKFISKSEERVDAKCPYFGVCGGCSLQNISYSDTLEYKKNKVINSFRKMKMDVLPEVVVNICPWNYRNKITLHVINGRIGYLEEESRVLVEVDECFIASESINKVISILKKCHISDGKVVIRSNLRGECLVVIKDNDGLSDFSYLKTSESLVGLVYNEQVVMGNGFLIEIINDIKYKYAYDSFFQVNPYIMEELIKIILSYIKNSDKVIDLYCGVGSISLAVARVCKAVLGVEVVESSIKSAKENAKLNNINNAEFILNDAKKEASKIPDGYNKIIVDPPRSGLDRSVVDMILAKEFEMIIYVSCDMHTLIRDIDYLKEKYEIKKLYVLDMFSYTYHAECLCVLEKR